MTTFASTSTQPPSAPPDPTKHVNYTLGMVLGVDDFTQEFAYLSGRDQWLARDILGYGTVCGLRVDKENGTNGPQITVSAGVALSPLGQLVRVSPAQCASLNDWLSANKDEVIDAFGSPPGPVARLYVLLHYRECPTDNQPIPGEPCRTEDEATAPSRIMDDFKLELRLKPPDQREEDAVREFVAWLAQIETTTTGSDSTPLDEFIDAVRGAVSMQASPPEPLFGSPPAELKIPVAEACDYLRAAFRIWVTEIRPLVRPCTPVATARCSEPDANTESELYGDILLAELNIGLTSDLLVRDLSSIDIIEDNRPFLIHLRMVQEMLHCGLPAICIDAGSPGGALPADSGFEADLTRIMALSWIHGATTMLEFKLDGNPVKGLVVGFGKSKLGDAGRVLVRRGSLDEGSFQVFVERRHTEGDYDWFDYVRLGPSKIVGVKPEVNPDGLIVAATATEGPASGAAFIISPAAFKTVWGNKLVIVLRGDLIRDESKRRAIDAEFVRGELPTGDRPHGTSVGIQGGRFESWVTVEMKININTATEEELRSLPAIGPSRATLIVKTRKELGGFKSVDDLLKVSGIGEDLLKQIKPFITVS